MQTNNIPTWEIEEIPLYADYKEIQGYKAIVRNDTRELLQLAKISYTPTPNKVFIETAKALSKVTGYPLEMITEVDNGKKMLAFLKVNDPMRIAGNEFKEWLMIGNSHDKTTGFFIGNSNMMVRCSNRFTKNFRMLQVYHTANHQEKISEIVDSFGTYRQQRTDFINTLGEYVNFEIVEEDKQNLVNLMADVTPEEALKPDIISPRKRNIITNIHECIKIETKALGNNALGLFNGATYYTTHIKKDHKKVFNNAIGTSNDLNQKAFNFCSSLFLKGLV